MKTRMRVDNIQIFFFPGVFPGEELLEEIAKFLFHALPLTSIFRNS